MNDLLVQVDARRQSTGRALFEAAVAWARERDAWWIQWQASTTAIHFYERLGYRGEECPDPTHPEFEILDEARVPPTVDVS